MYDIYTCTHEGVRAYVCMCTSKKSVTEKVVGRSKKKNVTEAREEGLGVRMTL